MKAVLSSYGLSHGLENKLHTLLTSTKAIMITDGKLKELEN